MKKILLPALFIFLSHWSICQNNHVEINKQTSTHVIELPKVNYQISKNDTCPTCLKPYGKKYIIDANLNEWHVDKNDSAFIYSLKVNAIGSVFLDIIFDNFKIQQGCILTLWSKKDHHVYNYKYSKNLNSSKALSISGEEVHIKYFVPDSLIINNDFLSISSITYVYDEDLSENTKQLKSLKQLTCHNDVNCSDGDSYRDIIRSVVLIRNLCDDDGNCSRCSGSVLNNTNGDFTPYVLTAHHCVQGEAEDNLDDAIFSFNYQRTTCNGNTPYGYFSNPYTVTGADLKAQRTAVMGSDFALLELNQTPPLYYNIFYAGWSRERNLTGSDVECIHHPHGEPKKISFGHIKGISLADYVNVEWDDGTVEAGSSGSPLFKNKRVVGNYSANWGGDNSCDDLGDGLFGHFASSWGSTWGSGRRLRDWLDPSDDDPDNLDGADPKK